MERAAFELARNTDLFNLRFQFQNYEIEVRNGASYLRPRWAFNACSIEGGRPRRIAIFSPQHVQEEVFHYKQQNGPTFTNLSGKDPLGQQAGVRPPEELKRNSLAMTRVSGPTRLVFEELDEESSALRQQEITVESITDWEDLALIVHERALSRDATLEEQLEVAGIDETTSRNQARAAILRSLDPDLGDVTALEPVTGLIFSPDESATFLTPKRAPGRGPVPIWSAKLHLQQQSAVRAIHARRYDDSFLLGVPSDDFSDLPFRVRRQSFWGRWRLELREGVAHLV